MPSATDYIGSAGLGLGSNPDVPAVSTANLDVIARTADRLQMQNADQNRRIFERKLQDRDKLLAELDAGNIKVGDLLEDDMPLVTEGLEKLENAYFERMKKGVNDIDAARNYNKAKREAQDRVTQAQARKIFYDSLAARMGKETLPRKQAAMKQHLDKTIKGGFFNDLLPYQETMDFDFDPIKGYVKMKTTETVDPKNGVFKIKTTAADVQSTLQEAQKDFLENNEAQQNQSALLNEYQKLDPIELKEQLLAFNSRLKPVGLDIKFEEFPDGSIAIKESIPDFAGKWALAAHPQLTASGSEFDKDYANYLQNERELAERRRHNKASEAIDWNKLGLEREKLNRAGVPGDVANSAKAYAEGLMEKLKSLAVNGVISPENMKKLTADELKYLGTAKTADNKFSLTPLNTSTLTGLRINEDGTIQGMGSGTAPGGGILGGIKNALKGGGQVGPSIDIKGIALNKMGDELTATTGKEMINFNNLIPLYKSGGTQKETKADKGTFNIQGNNFSKQELLNGGWTEDQINKAIKAGKIKAN